MELERKKHDEAIKERVAIKQRLQTLAGEKYMDETGMLRLTNRKTMRQLQEEDAARALMQQEQLERLKEKSDSEKKARLESLRRDTIEANKERALEYFKKSALSSYKAKASSIQRDPSEIFATLSLPLMVDEANGTSPTLPENIKKKQALQRGLLD